MLWSSNTADKNRLDVHWFVIRYIGQMILLADIDLSHTYRYRHICQVMSMYWYKQFFFCYIIQKKNGNMSMSLQSFSSRVRNDLQYWGEQHREGRSSFHQIQLELTDNIYFKEYFTFVSKVICFGKKSCCCTNHRKFTISANSEFSYRFCCVALSNSSIFQVSASSWSEWKHCLTRE